MPAMPVQCFPRTFVQQFEICIQSVDLAVGLCQMRFDGLAQLIVAGVLSQFRQRLGQLLFGVVQVLNLVDQASRRVSLFCSTYCVIAAIFAFIAL